MKKELIHSRIKRAGALVRSGGLGALAVVPGPNFFYLSGLNFHLMERPTLLVVTAQAEVLAVMPELERLKWSATFADARTFYWQDSDGFDGAFAALAAELGRTSLGVEGGRMRVFEIDALRRNFSADGVTDADEILQPLRICKDEGEIDLLSRAIAMSEAALEETLAGVRIGDSERAIAARVKMAMLSHGADDFAFAPIVLAGGRTANPHGVPDGTTVAPGDPLLFDFGARFDGFNADITRTVFCGHVTDEHAAIYETVLAANTAGRATAAPGVSAHELDVVTTAVLKASRFPELILHKTGHGLGLDVHEAPYVMIGNHIDLVPGMVITIEPGLYRPDDVGIRIEDDVVITESGARSLTQFDRALRIVAA